MASTSHRSVDHLVLPVVDLATARLRLSALGFAVAPEARHPFGTENACVYFTDSTYLEPLAIADLKLYRQSALNGNPFVQRDAAYRFRQGEDGLSAVVLTSEDSEADEALFQDKAIAAGSLRFSRPYRDADGLEGMASFSLAFAADLRAPDLFFFTCQRTAPLAVPGELLSHPNGVTGMAEIILAEVRPMDFEPFVHSASFSHDVTLHPHGVCFSTGTATISVCEHGYAETMLGLAPASGERGLVARGIVFDITDLAACDNLLDANGVNHHAGDGLIIVPPAPGQGVTFAFREA
ncbi:VOC family protein [Martelella alba]|uniref:VOC family protein n=1 Tax=Martelella alba TaxID=2590451 RepID=A0A506UII6_9HYPH|nr:VOC family protein [Martelella alba]TPW33083.1 VOC family protein [Martelella alba]